jgi:P-loop Domain of unknown function (DUF2791)
MTNMSQQDIKHIFERLRSGVVPELGLEAFAVGIDRVNLMDFHAIVY